MQLPTFWLILVTEVISQSLHVLRRHRNELISRQVDQNKTDIQPSANLPPLPLDYENEQLYIEITDPRLGNMDGEGNMFIPIDTEGNVLPGYEYLARPMRMELIAGNIKQINSNTRATAIATLDKKGKQSMLRQLDFEYDELHVIEPASLPSAKDYIDTHEVDPQSESETDMISNNVITEELDDTKSIAISDVSTKTEFSYKNMVNNKLKVDSTVNEFIETNKKVNESIVDHKSWQGIYFENEELKGNHGKNYITEVKKELLEIKKLEQALEADSDVLDKDNMILLQRIREGEKRKMESLKGQVESEAVGDKNILILNESKNEKIVGDHIIDDNNDQVTGQSMQNFSHNTIFLERISENRFDKKKMNLLENTFDTTKFNTSNTYVFILFLLMFPFCVNFIAF